MHFVIAGLITCPQFSYAVMVAQRLKENLPAFTYLKIPKRPEEWSNWLLGICKENDWHHVKSPIIWREIGLKQGKKDFIGDINKFLDLCYDYYGIPSDILSAEYFNKGEIKWFTSRTESEFFEDIKSAAAKRLQYRSRQVCITGAGSPMTEVIVLELLQMDLQKRENGLEIRLFDQPIKKCKLTNKALDGKHCPGPCGFGNCRVVNTLKEAFLNIDLVIVLDCFGRRPKESLVKWLKRNRNAMCILGKALNMYAQTHCRVIIGSPSNQPICYNATVLASFATKLHVRNIVTVTQDLGRESLNFLASKSQTPLKNFYCPPVWGFVGLNKFVDVRRTLYTHLYKVPGKRTNSTLPQGTAEYELRTSEGLVDEQDTDEVLSMVTQHKNQTNYQLGRWPFLAKATAILDLLRVWGLKQEDGNGEILCLGVYSDGAFNIPQGIYWSQPVILKNGFWVPFEEFPIPRPPNFDIHYLFLFSIAALYRTKVKPRIYISPKRDEKPKEKKKFDLDKMAQEVGMPVIRTDAECVSYLKYLAKKELGIDLDEVNEAIEEVTEDEVMPEEEVVVEQKFCECWREELKELQKLVFDRSSTTEVEVDLSENFSSSEWSVINFPSDLDSEKKNQSSSSVESQVGMEFLDKIGVNSYDSNVTCSCGKLSDGSICKCLGAAVGEKLDKEESVITTEHFYKEQNAMVFQEDLKDVIYEDVYEKQKHVSFDSEAKADDESKFKLKFHGRKDAARDEDADLKMRKRILKYERGGEDSVEEEEMFWDEKKGEIGSSAGDSVKLDAKGSGDEKKGEQDGFESSEELQNKDMKVLKSSKEFSGSEISPPPQVFPGYPEKSSESSRVDLFYSEGDSLALESYEKGFQKLPELPVEMWGETEYSITTLEENLNEIWEEESHGEMESEDLNESQPEKSLTKKKREGIPLCCLCRCLVPEGLPCCPCGATTVVEVFRKESIEVMIQSEDDINYTVEYFESFIRPDYMPAAQDEVEILVEPPELTLTKPELPPESFFPFSPKPENKFKEAVRPVELTKESINSFENEIHPECEKLMAEAKAHIEEKETEQSQEAEEGEEEGERDKENLPPFCEDEEHIKTDFSNLKLFIPCGIEDWRLTVQRKYREWFFQGPGIKDESYYDTAVEEVSDDEFDVDKELELYFEK